MAGSWPRPHLATAIALGLAAVAVIATHAQEPGPEGTWEYRQANPGRESGVDAEGDRLVLARSADGALTAIYFGLERAGEHGLHYTAVEATGVAQDADGTIRLTIPARTLYRTRPRSLDQARSLERSGMTRDALVFAIRLERSVLTATCTAVAGACPEPRMVFHRRIRTR